MEWTRRSIYTNNNEWNSFACLTEMHRKKSFELEDQNRDEYEYDIICIWFRLNT